MLRKTLTILSLIGLLLSVGLWGVSYRRTLTFTVWDSDDAWVLGELRDGHAIAFLQSLVLDHLPDAEEHHQDEEIEGPPAYLELNRPTKEVMRNVRVIMKDFVGQIGLHIFERFPKGFHYRSTGRSKDGGAFVAFGFPIWVVCLGLLTLFVATGHEPIRAAHRRRKRKKLGLCVKCGYDLRGSSRRCPECGEEFEP